MGFFSEIPLNKGYLSKKKKKTSILQEEPVACTSGTNREREREKKDTIIGDRGKNVFFILI